PTSTSAPSKKQRQAGRLAAGQPAEPRRTTTKASGTTHIVRGLTWPTEKARAHEVRNRAPYRHVTNEAACIEDLRNLAMVECEHGEPGTAHWAVNGEWKAAAWTIHAVLVRHEDSDSGKCDAPEQTDEERFHDRAMPPNYGCAISHTDVKSPTGTG